MTDLKDFSEKEMIMIDKLSVPQLPESNAPTDIEKAADFFMETWNGKWFAIRKENLPAEFNYLPFNSNVMYFFKFVTDKETLVKALGGHLPYVISKNKDSLQIVWNADTGQPAFCQKLRTYNSINFYELYNPYINPKYFDTMQRTRPVATVDNKTVDIELLSDKTVAMVKKLMKHFEH